MPRLGIFYTFAIFYAICVTFIGAECDSRDRQKKEKNIYTKEANEGDFKHEGDEEVVEVVEKETKKGKEKLDPEKAKEVMKLIRQLAKQLSDLFEKSFGTLESAITEIDKAFLNVTVTAEAEIVKIGKEKGKDLSEVTQAVKSIIDKSINEFGEYRKILRKKQQEAKSTSGKTALEISSDLDSKVIAKIIADEVQTMLKGGNKVNDVMNDMPEELDLVIEKTQIVLRKKLNNFEKTLDVDLSTVKEVSEKSLKEISSSVTIGLKQTSKILALTLNTLLGLVATLQAGVE